MLSKTRTNEALRAADLCAATSNFRHEKGGIGADQVRSLLKARGFSHS